MARAEVTVLSARKSAVVLFRRRRLRNVDFSKVDEPTAVLWREVEPWFRDDISHAGPDLEFSGLEPSDIENAWQFVLARADPLDPEQTAWDDVDDKEVSVVSLFDKGAVNAATRGSGVIRLNNIDVAGERLAWLGCGSTPKCSASTGGSTAEKRGARGSNGVQKTGFLAQPPRASGERCPRPKRLSNTTINTPSQLSTSPNTRYQRLPSCLPISYVNQVGTTNQAITMSTPTMTLTAASSHLPR